QMFSDYMRAVFDNLISSCREEIMVYFLSDFEGLRHYQVNYYKKPSKIEIIDLILRDYEFFFCHISPLVLVLKSLT
ncbi:hypothetical protein, partial [Caldisericum sp.]|uniref:hypothetical protein n=1 Tax=Caldisericum sp. TaxID=2499687 RepID=UPI003D102D0B